MGGEVREKALLAEYMEYLRDAGITEQWGAASFRWARGSAKEETASPQTDETPCPDSLEGVREFLGECTRC